MKKDDRNEFVQVSDNEINDFYEPAENFCDLTATNGFITFCTLIVFQNSNVA